jgi:single-strand DNA-binding protein
MRRADQLHRSGHPHYFMDMTISKEDTVNDLNSLLIEGTLVGDPASQEYGDVVESCTFTIVSHRITSTETRETVLPVRVYGTLGANCAEYLRKGRGVRIVGSIAVDAESLVVIGEHVEFRPMKAHSPSMGAAFIQ